MSASPVRMCRCSRCRLTGEETGIDVGLESFLDARQWGAGGQPTPLPEGRKSGLKRAQRRVSQPQEGQRRARRKAVRLLQRAHQKIARQRRDFHHKTALSLVKQYDTIYYEALQVANLVQNHHLAKSIDDAGWSQFCTILTFKAGNAGKRAVAVPPAYTSQICSGCGVVVQKGLSVRWHACPDCGTSLHRDHNAALNMLRVGQTRRASTQPVGAYVA